jgi:hypothetical protein
LVEITAEVLCPHILLPDRYLPEDDFYNELKTFVLGNDDGLNEDGLKDALISNARTEKNNSAATDLNSLLNTKILTQLVDKIDDIKTYIEALDTSKLNDFKNDINMSEDDDEINTRLNGVFLTSCKSGYITLRDIKKSLSELATLKTDCQILISIPIDINTKVESIDGAWKAKEANTIINVNGEWLNKEGNALSITNSYLVTSVNSILSELLTNVINNSTPEISEEFSETYRRIILEEQLLEEIRCIDKNRLFYYNVPIEANFAIDFNESDSKYNTLMNPAINYDINNINNNLVISKLDIDYLNKGLQIARSSRI